MGETLAEQVDLSLGHRSYIKTSVIIYICNLSTPIAKPGKIIWHTKCRKIRELVSYKEDVKE